MPSPATCTPESSGEVATPAMSFAIDISSSVLTPRGVPFVAMACLLVIRLPPEISADGISLPPANGSGQDHTTYVGRAPVGVGSAAHGTRGRRGGAAAIGR